jgi:peptidoglycan/xylan/chitin deacetylase (PgdA/CDA1 family)
MHNGKVSTLQALPTIIRALKSRGYAFATVDTLQKRLGASRIAAHAAEEHARIE